MNELASATVAPAGQLAPQAAPQIPSPLAEVASGTQPAAVLGPIQPEGAPDPAQTFVMDNFAKLGELGLDAVEAPDQSTVVFNTKLLDRKVVEKAAADGTLQSLLAPPPQAADLASATVNPAASQIAQASADGRPTAPLANAPVGPKVPAATQTALASARVKSLSGPGATTKNPPISSSNQLAKRPV